MATIAKRPPENIPALGEDVFTLAEAAAYLRVSEDALLDAVQSQRLPGRKVRDEWRFLKYALQNWLGNPIEPDFWETHLGALKGDPYLDEMLTEIYDRRGRPMSEDS